MAGEWGLPPVPPMTINPGVGTGEVIACFIIGIPLLKAAQKAFKRRSIT